MPDSLDEAIALMRYSDFLSKMTVIVNKVDMYMSFVVLPLSLVILLLSAVSVPKSLTRTFCLHMSVQCLLASVYYMGTEIYKEIYTRNYSIVDDRYRKFADIWNSLLDPIRIVLKCFLSSSYLFFGTLTVVISYLGYCFPFGFQRLTKNRFIVALVIFSIYVLSLSSSLLRYTPMFFRFFDDLDSVSRHSFIIHKVANLIMRLSCYIIMLFAYGKSLHEIVVTFLRKSSLNSSSKEAYWTNLKAILIYCTAPNLLAAITIASDICDFVVEYYKDVSTGRTMGSWFVYRAVELELFASATINLRFCISFVTALIGLRDYRNGLIRSVHVLFRCCIPKNVRGRVRATPVQSVSLNVMTSHE